MKCKYWDCGFCYAPNDVVTSASSQGACFDYEFCPYLKTEMTNQQPEVISSGTAIISDENGVPTKVHLSDKEKLTEMTEKMDNVESIEAEIKMLQSKLEFYKELSKTKSPVEEGYKKVYGYYPAPYGEDCYWEYFQNGYKQAQKDYKVGEYQETAQERGERVHNEMEEVVRESVRWCEEHPDTDPLDWLKPQNPEQVTEMLLLRQGKVDIVDYNHRTHYRIKYTDSFSGVYKWFVRKLGEIPFLEEVRDVNVYASLEELYQKEVVKQKDDYPYKKYTPEETEQSLKEAFREAVKQGVVSSVDKPQTLRDVCMDWWWNEDGDTENCDTENCIEDLVSRIEKWLPTEHETNSYKWNECIRMIREKLR